MSGASIKLLSESIDFSRVQEIIKSHEILVRPKEARHQCSGQAPLPADQPEHDPKGGSVAPAVICQDSTVFVGCAQTHRVTATTCS